MITARIDNG